MNTDPGIEILHVVSTLMQIDAEWCQWGQRGFTWWGCPLAQTVWAEPPKFRGDREVTRVHSRTAIIRNPKDTSKLGEILSALNGLATMSAYDWDPRSETIALHASVNAHADNVDWLKWLFANAVALQLAEAPRVAELLWRIVGGKLAASAHPRSGLRVVPDEMVRIIETAYLPNGGNGPPDLTRPFNFLEDECFAPSGWPYHRDDRLLVSPISMNNVHTEFAVLRIDGRERHPRVGHGALFTLVFPEEYDWLDPVRLNRLEIEEELAAHLLGGWTRSPEGRITFATFLPSFICFPAFFHALFVRSLNRAEWLGRRAKTIPR